MSVVQTTRLEIAFSGYVQRSNSRITVARRPCRRISEQVHFARQTRKRGRYNSARFVFNHQLRDKNRVVDIRKGIVKSLARVHLLQRLQVARTILPHKHRERTSSGLSKDSMTQQGM